MSRLPEDLHARGASAAAEFELTDEHNREHLTRVFALSDFAQHAAQRHRSWFVENLTNFNQPPDEQDLRSDVERMLAGVSTMNELQRSLRQLRQRYQLWVVWRHCLGSATLEETTASCSLMADVLINSALTVLSGWAVEERGVPIGRDSLVPQSMVVIALGKLGAFELNLSSDVDLMFCYPESGMIEGGELNQQFFVRLGQQLIQALDPVTEDGFVFRVDMRLRPYGGSGPLALDFNGVENYYATQGRDWERYALMKARPCAGDLEAGTRLLHDLSPFVFRRYLDFGAIDALRTMKARLVADRQHPDDVKLGPGGIRDVEFSVQMQQMIWGGREPDLRSSNLLRTIDALLRLGHLEETQARGLADGYRFLRDTEHSLQAESDRQTQRLPESAQGRLRLAVSRGYDSYASFKAALDEHRQTVAAVFENLLGPQPTTDSVWRSLWDDPNEQRLLACGFQDAQSASQALNILIKARDRASVSGEARNRLDELMPGLLEDIVETDSPDLSLSRVLPIIRTVLRRSAYLVLLSENPHARTHFVGLVTTSLWLSESLTAHPAFFDALLDERLLSIVPDRLALTTALNEELAGVGNDIERCLEVLREFKNHHVFNVALAEMRGTLSLMEVSDALTFLAEAILEAALAIAWQDNLDRFPEYADSRPFIVIGYGKLGGIELGPGSDLDLVFVHDLPVSAGPFLHRLVRRLLHILTAQTYNGTLYEIDTRLRPSGSAGTMVSSLEAFKEYQQKRAWVWEQQALVRARVVAGDRDLGERFDKLRRQLLEQPRQHQQLLEEVVTMRARISEQHVRGKAGDEDLKRASGGIVDIEFMVQYLVLANASAHPSLTEYTDNVRILDEVARLKLLPDEVVVRLRTAYLGLRAEWHRSVLDIPDTERASQTLSRYRDDVTTTWALLFDR